MSTPFTMENLLSAALHGGAAMVTYNYLTGGVSGMLSANSITMFAVLGVVSVMVDLYLYPTISKYAHLK